MQPVRVDVHPEYLHARLGVSACTTLVLPVRIVNCVQPRRWCVRSVEASQIACAAGANAVDIHLSRSWLERWTVCAHYCLCITVCALTLCDHPYCYCYCYVVWQVQAGKVLLFGVSEASMASAQTGVHEVCGGGGTSCSGRYRCKGIGREEG